MAERPPPDVPMRRTGRQQENFPVASILVRRDLRGAMLAFYEVARAADDIADDPGRPAAERHAALRRLEAGLRGEAGGDPRALHLRDTLEPLGRGAAIGHAQALFGAFHRDVDAARYDTWEELMGYCRLSADPVGRFVLELHGEGPETDAPSDALCTALQVLNHMQDLRSDYSNLGRVYLPLDWLGDPEALAATRLDARARAALERALARAQALLDRAEALPGLIAGRRLAAEVRVIVSLARSLHRRLVAGDPLAGRIEAGRGAYLAAGAAGLAELARPRPDRGLIAPRSRRA